VKEGDEGQSIIEALEEENVAVAML